jgi:hypothetical protein
MGLPLEFPVAVTVVFRNNIKGKVVFALNKLINYRDHKDVGEIGGIAPSSLTSSLNVGEWSASDVMVTKYPEVQGSIPVATRFPEK